MSDQTDTSNLVLPFLPLRDVVVYPHMVIPLFVGRPKSIAALESAMADDKQVVLVAQRDPNHDDPSLEDVFKLGTVATILQLLKLPDGTVKVLVEGGNRAEVVHLSAVDEFVTCEVIAIDDPELENESEEAALIRMVVEKFENYVKLNKKIPSEVLTSLNGIDELSRLIDTIAAQLPMPLDKKQEVLEACELDDRVKLLLSLIGAEVGVMEVEKEIRGRVKKQMEKSQREYYLNEQMKAIQKELDDDEQGASEMDALRDRIDSADMPEEAKAKAESEFKKLKMMSPMSAEANVVRGYLDWIIGVPWSKRSRVKLDLKKAKEILDADHHGLEEVKERILEFLAVQKRVRKLNGPVLCLVGPPGVGKTSLGESIARATGRKFVRMALGGVRDEAELRGHRRTYIGSMPGKLIQKMSKAEVKNPLFLLDEIDKMGSDHRGDPSSALLEILDPEQNKAFNDHYLEVDYDLSEVMFLCTSNSMNIPAPLLDRMEVIRIPGYTEDEKLNIAKKYLFPKQKKANGVKDKEISLEDTVLLDVIRHYTREAGVRNLERQIAKVCRRVVKGAALDDMELPKDVQQDDLQDLLGVARHKFGVAEEDNQIGQVTGLAWTSVGGEILHIEATSTVGKGRQIKTGSLGDVMQESITAASTVVRARSQALGIKATYHDKNDLHIHVPQGATPKDGPSAGIAMCTALVSVMTGIPVRADVAMTGEITLRGQVLEIGGLKEKLLAAHRGGIKKVLIPEENAKDLADIPENILGDIEVLPVKWIDEVLANALESAPEPLSDEEYLEGLDEHSAKSEPKKESAINTH